MSKGIIYLITNTVSNKKYVGQTIGTLEKRKKQHINKSKRSKIGIDRAIKKYGIKNFKWQIIEECSRDILNKKEIYYIKKFKTFANNKNSLGYNLTKGGNNYYGASGEFHYLKRMSSKEYKEWIQKHRKGKNNPNYDNGEKIKGENHYFNKMTIKEKEEWKNKHLRGKNNYQFKMSKSQLKEKCYINKMTIKEKEEWKNKHLRGENNPFNKVAHLYRGKNNKHYKKLGKELPWHKKYIITFPNNKKFLTESITEFCYIFNKNNKTKLLKSGLYLCANNYTKKYKGFKCRHWDKIKDKNIPLYSGEKD